MWHVTLVTLHVNQKLPLGRLFFYGADVGIIADGVDVMAALEDHFDERKRKQRRKRLVEEQRRAEEKEKTAKEDDRRKRVHRRKKRPT